jgi:nitroreductase
VSASEIPCQPPAAGALLALLRGRRSIRAFQDRPVPRADLERLLEAATWAPSADNRQTWRFIVFRGERKAELASLLRSFVDEMHPGANPLLWVHRRGLRRSAQVIAGSAATVTAWATFGPESLPLRIAARGDLSPLFSWTMVVQSVAAAVQNLLLEAHALGLGAVWIGYPCLAGPEIGTWLGEGGVLQATVALGYPAESPGEGRRKPVRDVVRWEG